ncbi:hypothetical protein DIPPA_02216 [Diplonema papillatum]|nr:hypothetical protein DIPPA_02216 [Diplonema papillatum]
MPRIGEGHRTAWQYAAAAVLPWLLVASWASLRADPLSESPQRALVAVAAEAEGAAARAAGAAAKREGCRRLVAAAEPALVRGLLRGHAAVAAWVAAHPRLVPPPADGRQPQPPSAGGSDSRVFEPPSSSWDWKTVAGAPAQEILAERPGRAPVTHALWLSWVCLGDAAARGTARDAAQELAKRVPSAVDAIDGGTGLTPLAAILRRTACGVAGDETGAGPTVAASDGRSLGALAQPALDEVLPTVLRTLRPNPYVPSQSGEIPEQAAGAAARHKAAVLDYRLREWDPAQREPAKLAGIRRVLDRLPLRGGGDRSAGAVGVLADAVVAYWADFLRGEAGAGRLAESLGLAPGGYVSVGNASALLASFGRWAETDDEATARVEAWVAAAHPVLRRFVWA